LPFPIRLMGKGSHTLNLRSRMREAEQQLLAGPHPERARQDAERLALFLLGKDRAWLLSNQDEPVPATFEATFVQAFSQLIARRRAGEPIQYITGHAEFFGLPFAVTPGVLIPRPETEHLVEEVLRLSASLPNPKIADIGTGSGAIAVALAHNLPQAQITATDLSPQALAIARRNADSNLVADRIEFLEGDLLTPIAGRRFSMIVSNPPYVPLRDRASLSVEVRDHEPHSALFAGDDGLDVYRRLIPDAYPLLIPGGWLVIEIGFGQKPAIEEMMAENKYESVHFIADYQEIPRIAAGQIAR